MVYRFLYILLLILFAGCSIEHAEELPRGEDIPCYYYNPYTPCPEGMYCGSDHYCHYNHSGSCLCSTDESPYCGYNDTTYLNECFANCNDQEGYRGTCNYGDRYGYLSVCRGTNSYKHYYAISLKIPFTHWGPCPTDTENPPECPENCSGTLVYHTTTSGESSQDQCSCVTEVRYCDPDDENLGCDPGEICSSSNICIPE